MSELNNRRPSAGTARRRSSSRHQRYSRGDTSIDSSFNAAPSRDISLHNNRTVGSFHSRADVVGGTTNGRQRTMAAGVATVIENNNYSISHGTGRNKIIKNRTVVGVDKSQQIAMINGRINEKNFEKNRLEKEMANMRHGEIQRAALNRRRQQLIHGIDETSKKMHSLNNYEQLVSNNRKDNIDNYNDCIKKLMSKINSLALQCSSVELELERSINLRRQNETNLQNLKNLRKQLRENLDKIRGKISKKDFAKLTNIFENNSTEIPIGMKNFEKNNYKYVNPQLLIEYDRISSELLNGRKQLDLLESKFSEYLSAARKNDNKKAKLIGKIGELRELQHRKLQMEKVFALQNNGLNMNRKCSKKNQMMMKNSSSEYNDIHNIEQLQNQIIELNQELDLKTKKLESLFDKKFLERFNIAALRYDDVQKFINNYEDFSRAERIETLDKLKKEIDLIKEKRLNSSKNYLDSLSTTIDVQKLLQNQNNSNSNSDRTFLQRVYSSDGLNGNGDNPATASQVASYGMQNQKRKLQYDLNNLDELRIKVDKELKTLRESLRESRDDEKKLENAEQDLEKYNNLKKQTKSVLDILQQDKIRLEELVHEKTKILNNFQQGIRERGGLNGSDLELLLKVCNQKEECEKLRQQVMKKIAALTQTTDL